MPPPPPLSKPISTKDQGQLIQGELMYYPKVKAINRLDAGLGREGYTKVTQFLSAV